MELKELTKAEEEIMHLMWDLEKAYVKDVIEKLPEPKPAYNTVSTFIRILETKGFISHQAFGKTYLYFPVVSREDYRKFVTTKLKAGYFGNSVGAMMSFFVENEEINLKEADEILRLIQEMKNKK
jgi:BlaI family transcriptional regulator, penicillinase repressor